MQDILRKITPSVTRYFLRLNKIKLHELLYQNKKFFVKYTTTQTTNTGVSLSWTVNNQQGSVTWVITNNSSQPVSVGLYRGVPNYSPTYFFGEAFNMVYLKNNLVTPCTSPQQEFCLGILSYLGIMRFPAFVFNIPPSSQYQITEYGFPPNPQIVAKLIELTPIGQQNVVVYYDPILPQVYMQEAGQQVSYEPDPYTMTTYVYNMKENIPNEFGYLVMINSPLTNNQIILQLYLNLLLALPFPIDIL
jgi:hypothetical protein